MPGAKFADPPSMESFGEYVMLAELGSGGMADVFLALAGTGSGLGFKKLVVLKRVRRGLADDPDFVSMFVDEARLAARLNHANVVQTHEVGEVAGEYYMAMEYLEGQTFSKLTTMGRRAFDPMPAELGVNIMSNLLDGLHYAHELKDFDGAPLGVVHRDVSPQNVFVTYDGQVKIVDFGIARAEGRIVHTSRGVIKGKVFYMAPEQARGVDVDRRADVFSVGIMLWEILTDGRYWEGCDETTAFGRLLQGKLPGPPSSVREGVDPELERICMRALALSPDDRYATAEEMAIDLRRVVRENRTRDIADFASRVCAEKRARTQQVVEQQIAMFETASAKTVPRSTPSLRVAAAHAASKAEQLLAEQQLGYEPTMTAETSLARPVAKTRWHGVAAGLGAVMALVVIVGVQARHPSHHAAVANGLSHATALAARGADQAAALPQARIETREASVAPETTRTTTAAPRPAVAVARPSRASHAVVDAPVAKPPVVAPAQIASNVRRVREIDRSNPYQQN